MRYYLLILSAMLASLAGNSQTFTMMVGTYTNTGSKGIYVYNFNVATGKAKLVSTTDGVVNPSYLAFSPNKKYVFAVNETNGNNPGKVSSFAFDKSTGKLSFINQQPTGGDDPCYVSVHKNNRWIAVGNYSSGNASVFKVDDDGSIQPYAQLMQDTGKGPNAARQQQPHVHGAVFSPDYTQLYTPDLGTDKLMAYQFNAVANKPLTPATSPFIAVTPGGGPRHLTFAPNHKFAYVVEELTGTVTAFNYAHSKLIKLQTISTHPADYKGAKGSADIHISPDGKFLYASNRGDANSIAIFSINPSTGKLTTKGFQSTQGKAPRNFAIDPTGAFLIVANQDTNNIVLFKRNKTTGLLTPTGFEINVPRPVCIKLQ